MKVCGHEFTDTMIQMIQEKVNQDPSLSRRALSRLVCEWLDWKSPNGKQMFLPGYFVWQLPG